MSDSDASSNVSEQPESFDDGENGPVQIEQNAERRSAETRPYDIDLSARHTYMGSLSAANPGSTLFEAGETVDLFVIDRVEDILLPGQIIPFNINDAVRLSVMRKLNAKGRKVFGIIYRPMSGDLKFFRFPKGHTIIGVTAEIIEISDDVGISLKALIRQTFTSDAIRRDTEGNSVCTAKILPEVTLPDIGDEIRPKSLKRLQVSSIDDDTEEVLTRPSMNFSVFTPWPEFVFKMYDKKRLLKAVRNEVSSRPSHCGTNIPKDPQSMSYWIGTNFPTRIDKLNILSISCDVQRLRHGLNIFKESKNQSFECSVCGLEVFKSNSMFTMSIEGPQSNYVNPGGYIFEVVTVYVQTAMHPEGQPSTEATWFPGYEWIIGRCNRCGRHLGWIYRATDPSLNPQRFYAVMKRSVTPVTLSKPPDVPLI